MATKAIFFVGRYYDTIPGWTGNDLAFELERFLKRIGVRVEYKPDFTGDPVKIIINMRPCDEQYLRECIFRIVMNVTEDEKEKISEMG